MWAIVCAKAEPDQKLRITALRPRKARATSDRSIVMNKEQIEGAAKKGVGAVKEAAGKAIGNTKLQAEGVAEKAVGAAEEAAGDVKAAVHKATK